MALSGPTKRALNAACGTFGVGSTIATAIDGNTADLAAIAALSTSDDYTTTQATTSTNLALAKAIIDACS